jgi:hypothetical protein
MVIAGAAWNLIVWVGENTVSTPKRISEPQTPALKAHHDLTLSQFFLQLWL